MTICVSLGRRLSAASKQILERLDTRLGLGLAGLGAGLDPLALAADGTLAGIVLAAFLLEALGLGFEVLGVVAFVRDAAATVELEDPAGDIVEEVAIVGDDHHRARIGAQMLFQPRGGFGIEMVGRFVEQQQVGLAQQQLAQCDTATLATRQLGDVGILGRAAERFHRHLDLLFEIPQIEPVHLVLELGGLVRRLVGIVHHQLIVALDDGGLGGDAFHDVFENRLVGIERRLLRQVADGGAFGQPRLAVPLLVEPGHDLEDRRLAGAVRPQDADLGVRVEGEMDILEHLLGAVGLVEAGHVIDELACHARFP
jgi:hypothetical protein